MRYEHHGGDGGGGGGGAREVTARLRRWLDSRDSGVPTPVILSLEQKRFQKSFAAAESSGGAGGAHATAAETAAAAASAAPVDEYELEVDTLKLASADPAFAAWLLGNNSGALSYHATEIISEKTHAAEIKEEEEGSCLSYSTCDDGSLRGGYDDDGDGVSERGRAAMSLARTTSKQRRRRGLITAVHRTTFQLNVTLPLLIA
jgi:hypothetical protein